MEPGDFFDGSPEPSLMLDRSGRVLALNRAFERAFGWGRAAVGGPVEAMLGDAGALTALLADPGAGAPLEAEVVSPGRAPHAAEWRLAAGPGGTRLAVVRDVAVRVAERRRAEAVERIAGIGSWERDPGGALTWSPGLHALCGTDPGTFDPGAASPGMFLAPADARRLLRGVAALRRRGTAFDLELAVPVGCGGTIWIRATGAADADGRLHGTVGDVTLKRTRRQFERVSAVARLTTDAVFVADNAARIEWANEAFAAQTGYDLAEVVGRTVEFLDSPATDPAEMARLMAAVEAGEAFRGELANIRRDGREIIVALEVHPMRAPSGAITGWVSVRRDVTEERAAARRLAEAERAAAASRAQLVAAVEALDDAFVLYDSDERLMVCNRRFRDLYPETAHLIVLGERREDMLRRGVALGQWPDAVGREEEWIAERMAAHRNPTGSAERPLPGGRWIRAIERPTPDGGLVGLQIDITSLKRQQLLLEDALRRAEEASEAKSSFLATMSHEIRTPMNGILGLADLLAQTPLDPAQAVLVGDLRGSGESLLRILNDILDFSKIEAGRIALEAIAFDPREVARRVEALHGPLAGEKGLALRVEAADGPWRLGDSTRLLQVAGNLVSNAVKFTEAGEVVLRLSNPAEGELRLEVSDTGIGMTLEESARVFERFAQADTSVTRRFGGTGLGLSIVRGIVAAMDGRLEVWSAPGEGTRIGVELPLRAVEAPRPAPLAEPTGDLAGLRVLAADDNAMNRRVLTGMLDRLGARHEVVGSGAEAVAAARAGGHDLLLLDISMPDMDGMEALAAIGAEARAAGRGRAPALAVTANVLESQVEAYLAAGFDGHLPKPLRIPALAAAARAALDRASAA